MKRLIDVDALIGEIIKAQDSLVTDNDDLFERNKGYFKGLVWANRIALEVPTIDAVPVVRCKDCKWWIVYDDVGYCDNPDGLDNFDRPDDFCSYGERKEGEDNG